MNISLDTIKLLEGNIGKKFLDIGLGNDILDMTKSIRNNIKNQQVEYNIAEAVETVKCWLPRAQGLCNCPSFDFSPSYHFVICVRTE